MITYNCNFKCPYCFEKEAVGKINIKKTFTKEIVDRAYAAIEEIQPDKELRTKIITLFGGEPFLKENKEVIRYVIEQGEKRGFRFDAVTNGYDLDSYKEMLSSEYFNSFLITVDGKENRHNSTRMHKEHYPTFGKIVDNIGLVLNSKIGVTVRVNTDKSNINDLKDLQVLFDSLHYTDYPNFFIDSSILRNYDPNLQDAEKERFFTTKDFIEVHKKIKFKYGCNSLGVFSNIYAAITRQKPIQFRSTFCGAQAGSYVFDPFGKIYTCWEVVGKKEFEIADYFSTPIKWDQERLALWQNHDITTVKSCSMCKYSLLCGGGCLALNWDIHKCNNMPDMIKYAANMAYNNYKLNKNETCK